MFFHGRCTTHALDSPAYFTSLIERLKVPLSNVLKVSDMNLYISSNVMQLLSLHFKAACCARVIARFD